MAQISREVIECDYPECPEEFIVDTSSPNSAREKAIRAGWLIRKVYRRSNTLNNDFCPKHKDPYTFVRETLATMGITEEDQKTVINIVKKAVYDEQSNPRK